MRNYRKIESRILGPTTGKRKEKRREKVKTPTASGKE